MGALHGRAIGARGRAVVAGDLQVLPAAGFRLELHPVHGRGAAHEVELLLGVAEQDAVADNVAIGCGRHHLLGAVDREGREGVDGQVLEILEGVGAFDQHFSHVVALVEQHGGVAPGLHFAAEVGKLRGHHRIDIGAQLRIAQVLDGVAGGLEDVLEISRAHVSVSS